MERNSLTPNQLQDLFNKAATVNIAPLLSPLPANLYSHPTLVPGEQILLQQENTAYVNTKDGIVEGIFHLTTYRVMFTGSSEKYVCHGDTAFDMEPEDIARVGQRNQNRKKSPLAHVNKGLQTLLDARRRQDRLRYRRKKMKVAGPLMYSQSVKSHSNKIMADIPCDRTDNSVTLKSFKPMTNRRPVVKSNLTNIAFPYDLEVSIPCTSIYDIRKYSRKNLPKEESMFFGDGFELLCCNIRSFKFCPGNQAHFDAEKVMKHLLKYTRPAFNRLFAFSHKNTVLVPKSCDIIENKAAPNFYCFNDEFKRMRLMGTWQKWRLNEKKSCSSYPPATVVPKSVDDTALAKVTYFHRNGCFPTVCWKSQESDAVMLRSSVPVKRRGLSDSRCHTDETYLATICSCNKSAAKHKLVIFTESSKQSSNQGLLNQQNLTPEQGETFYYPHCRFVYCDVPPDFKAVRQSANRLQNFLSSKIDDGKYFSSLEDTEWLSQIGELLQTATQITVAIENDKSSVLISYEEGVDRTAQLTSLAQLMLDPYYRTLDGFQVLIQKEWLSFRHPFADRGSSQPNTEGQGPICLQWLDCVWQLIQQFPFSFEFNEFFLETVANHLYSSRFGTFLVNSKRKEAQESSIEDKTFSLWTWINVKTMADTDVFINPRYDNSSGCSEHEHRVLIPQYNTPCLKLWSSYYTKYQQEEGLMDANKAARLQALKLEQDYKDLLSRYFKLIQKIADLDSRDETSRNAFYTASLKPFRKLSGNDINCLLNGSDLSLDNTVGIKDSCESLTSLASTASGDAVYYNAANATVKTARLQRRLTRSRSLDDMLDSTKSKTLLRQNYSKRGTSLKRVGSSKFYAETLLSTDLQKETKTSLKHYPISEKFSSLHDYLNSTGIDYDSESHVQISKMKCCGYMVKQGGMPKNWKKRWFVLDLTKKYLAYFETEQAQQPKGAISYQSITGVYEHKKQNKNRFCVDTPGRTYLIDAPSEKSKVVWTTCLRAPLQAFELHKDS